MDKWKGSNVSGCPCDGCVPPDREIGCHGKCGKYIEWSNALRKRRLEEYKARQESGSISHSALRKIWIKSRWQNQQHIRRSGGHDD